MQQQSYDCNLLKLDVEHYHQRQNKSDEELQRQISLVAELRDENDSVRKTLSLDDIQISSLKKNITDNMAALANCTTSLLETEKRKINIMSLLTFRLWPLGNFQVATSQYVY